MLLFQIPLLFDPTEAAGELCGAVLPAPGRWSHERRVGEVSSPGRPRDQVTTGQAGPQHAIEPLLTRSQVVHG